MALQLNFTIKQGETADSTVIPPLTMENEDGTPFDSLGWTGKSFLKKQFSDEAETVEFLVALNGAEVQLSLTAAQTSALEPGDYVYDAKISKDDIVRHILFGRVIIAPEVSRP